MLDFFFFFFLGGGGDSGAEPMKQERMKVQRCNLCSMISAFINQLLKCNSLTCFNFLLVCVAEEDG